MGSQRVGHDWVTFTSVQLFVTLWTPASLSIEFSRQKLVWFATAFSRGFSWPRGLNRGLLHCRQVLYHLSHQGSPTKTWKQPKCTSKVEWIKKMWYIHTVEYYSAIEKKEIMPFCSNMDGPRDYHTKPERQITCYHWYVESKELMQMNLYNRNRPTHIENKLTVTRWERGEIN